MFLYLLLLLLAHGSRWAILIVFTFVVFCRMCCLLFASLIFVSVLLPVDNSFQFDATRDLLRELDVNDIVWIGLMRPQNSDRFMWS